MSFIAAVRVRVEREGRRGGSEKKKGSQRGDPNIHYSTFMCALLFFFSPFLFGKVLFSFFAAAFVRCKVSKPSPLTRSHASQPTSHSRQNVPRKKNPKQTKKQRRLNLGSAGRDATQRSRHARERCPDFPSGYVAN